MGMSAPSVAEIKRQEARIKEDVQHVNELTTIQSALQAKDRVVAQAAMESMRRLLVFFLGRGDLQAIASKSTDAKKSKTDKDDAVDVFRQWLWDIYVAFIQTMLEWLRNGADSNTQVNALRTLMEFVSRESELRPKQATSFGNETFMRVVQVLATHENLDGELATIVQGEYIGAFRDVQYFMLRDLAQLLDAALDDKKVVDTASSKLVPNALRLLFKIELADNENELKPLLVDAKILEGENDEASESEDEEEEVKTGNVIGNKRKAYDTTSSTTKNQVVSLKRLRHVFSTCWVALLRHRLPAGAYKRVLMKLPFEIMPYLENPLLLADFLTDSYNMGSVTSLLALNGLFILITDHNFDYPDFYPKLYQLLDDPTMLTVKQRFRFFGLFELFMSSTHLPAYLVAAFAKRLSRLSLHAEPGVLRFTLPMVYNLIIRHKECLQLIHRTGANTAAELARKRRQELASSSAVDVAAQQFARETTEIVLKDGNDPYRSDEKDPQQSHALQSSLWEIATLKNHYNAEVARYAKMFEEPLRTRGLELDECMDITYKSIFDQQLKRKAQRKAPLAFAPCTGLFADDDGFASVFQL